VIAFRRLDLSNGRNLYFLVATLQELLKEISSSDATLCDDVPDGASDGKDTRRGPLLSFAIGGNWKYGRASGVRWSLGLLQLQEALLSASLLLRQHLEKTAYNIELILALSLALHSRN